jgi:rare lipoprotein A
MGRLLSILILASGTALSAGSAGSALDTEVGLASYYGRRFDGRITASGVPFDNDAMVAAHPVHAFGTLVLVTNLRNGESVQVRIVDRGPARGPRTDGVIIDLSRAAARVLGFLERGRTRVRVEVLRLP